MLRAMRKDFSRIISMLPEIDRRQLWWIFAIMLAMGLIEAVGVGSILPFMAAVMNIDQALENDYLRYFYDNAGFSDKNQFVIFLGGLVLFVQVARNIFFAIGIWLTSRFSLMCRHHLSETLLSRYLMQPYAYYLTRNTLDLRRNVCNEVNRAITGVLMPGIRIVTKVIVSCFILILLLIIDPVITLGVALGLGGIYAGLYNLFYKKLNRLSKLAKESRRLRFKSASEALAGIKEIKLLGREDGFVCDYSRFSRQNSLVDIKSQVISQMPIFAIETLFVSIIMLGILYLLSTEQNLSHSIPMFALYAVAGYRLMPAVQAIFSNLTSIRYNKAILDVLHADFTSKSNTSDRPGENSIAAESFRPIRAIELRDITFHYPGHSEPVINNLNLVIQKNTTVALVGSTGSGKTTIIDILLGLLRPSGGRLLVNDIEVESGNVKAWQSNLGYVPQHIYLSDDTIARNIAFGIPENELDSDALVNAATTANLHDFIVHELPNGYQTMVGERGIRLSGGQRQRIGIARALYHNPSMIVLDEATSALDGVTESVVMSAIQNLSHQLTIVMVAHRLNTVEHCDTIHVIQEGSIVSSGTFPELSRSCEYFRQLQNTSEQCQD